MFSFLCLCFFVFFFLFFLRIRRPPRSTLDRSSAASDVYKRQEEMIAAGVAAIVVLGGTANLGVATKAAVDAGIPVFGSDAAYLGDTGACLLYTSPSPRDRTRSRMPSSA